MSIPENVVITEEVIKEFRRDANIKIENLHRELFVGYLNVDVDRINYCIDELGYEDVVDFIECINNELRENNK